MHVMRRHILGACTITTMVMLALSSEILRHVERYEVQRDSLLNVPQDQACATMLDAQAVRVMAQELREVFR